MGFGAAIASGFRNYVTTRGRATRSEFWYWTLFSVLAGIAGSIADAIIGSAAHAGGFSIVAGIVNLALFLPGIAVTIRRLHDTDHSGWWCLLPITIIGIIPYLIWVCSRGTPGANRYGIGTTADIAGVFGDGTPATAPTFQNQRF